MAGSQQFFGVFLNVALSICFGGLLCALLWPLFTLPLQVLHRWRSGPAAGSVWLRIYLRPPAP